MIQSSPFPFLRVFLFFTFWTTGQGMMGQTRSFSNSFHTKKMIRGTDTVSVRFLKDATLFTQKWDTLGQAKFWKTIMQLSPDSAALNVASTREILENVLLSDWQRQTDKEKEAYKAAIRTARKIKENERIFVTSGKSDFYAFEKAIAHIDPAIKVFESHGVDPWYCQTILLIESPVAHNVSSGAGAHGPFQLMKSVALNRGLKVNAQVDEREDLVKASTAACKLLKYMCIPETRKMLERHHIPYKEDDLWFRLLVLHSYHAGIGNVSGLIDKIKPAEGGMRLIRTIWKTEYKNFRNASQNYSQVALAALLSFEDLIQTLPDTIYLLEGDKAWIALESKAAPNRHPEEIKAVLKAYTSDLYENRADFDVFIQRVRQAEYKIAALEMKIPSARSNAPYLQQEKEINTLGLRLLKRRQYDKAVACFRHNVATHPESWNAYDSLGYVYQQTGQIDLAIRSYKKSVRLNPGNARGKKALEALQKLE